MSKRIYYAIHAVGLAADGDTSVTALKAVQSAGSSVRFNQEQIYQLGTLNPYENIETLPEVELTIEKALDDTTAFTTAFGEGPIINHMDTKIAAALAIYPDTQSITSGTAESICYMSGMFLSSLSYRFPVQGPATESMGLVGNKRSYSSGATFTGFAAETSGDLVRREDIDFGSGQTELPSDIDDVHSLQSVSISCNLGREDLFKLGQKKPFHKYATYPFEVRTDIEVIAGGADGVEADDADDAENTTDEPIKIVATGCGTFDCGDRNRLSNTTYSGGNAGQGGGNATITYSYTNFNELSVTLEA